MGSLGIPYGDSVAPLNPHIDISPAYIYMGGSLTSGACFLLLCAFNTTITTICVTRKKTYLGRKDPCCAPKVLFHKYMKGA